MKIIAIGLLLLVDTCGSRESGLDRVLSELRCGMSAAEVQSLVGRRVEATSNKPELGTHRMDGKWRDVWLSFREDRLESFVSGELDGLSSVRLSPKKNLCTGQLTFFVSLEWVAQMEGADVFLDNQLVQEGASSGLILEVLAGQHELRVMKAGYRPIVRRLRLGPASEGRTDILITSSDLRSMRIGRSQG